MGESCLEINNHRTTKTEIFCAKHTEIHIRKGDIDSIAIGMKITGDGQILDSCESRFLKHETY